MEFDTKNIRNVVLLGHSGCGKTTLAEAMLFEAKEITRRGSISNKNTVSDYASIEQERENSMFSTLMHANWKDSKINIVDTPGSDDFVGEVIASMKVADTALMVLNAASGVEVGTEILWEYIEKYKTPTVFIINHLDNGKSDYETTLEQAKSRFGTNVIPIQYPLNQGDGFNTIVDTLRMIMYVFPPEGGKPKKEPIPESEMAKAQEMHNALVEAAAENDEGLMEIFFEEGSLTETELTKGLKIALSNQEIFPVFCCSGERNMGTGRVMGFVNDVCPSPGERPAATLSDGSTISCDKQAEPIVFIYKTISEPRIGNVSYFKVYGGTLKSGEELYNYKTNTSERINQIFISNGKDRKQVDSLIAGDIGVTVKLKNTHSNNTLTHKGDERMIEEMHFPNSRIRTAVVPPNKGDLDKLAKAFNTLQEEDPTFIVEHAREIKQTILHGQGQLHLDLIKHRVEQVYGLQMEFIKPRISYRETITKMANDSYRHKKQSGGSGQFAEVHMRIEPYQEGMPNPAGLTVRNQEVVDLPSGGKLAFYWCIVGGSIDAKFSNAIKKGVMQKMEEGPLTGSPCIDIRVSIYDGKMHPVDSNDMAFQLAGTMVFKNAFESAGPKLLEPIYNVEILCAHDAMGDIMGDLQTRRAIIMGMDSEGHYQKIKAKVPLAELYQYSSVLRSLTQGKAKFSRSFAEFSQVTGEIQKKLVAEYKAELENAH